MNYRIVVNQVGLLLVVLSAIMLATAGWSLAAWRLAGDADERLALFGLLVAAGAGAAVGGLSILATRTAPRAIGRREALLLVAASWILGAALAGLPYLAWALLAQHAEPERWAGHPFTNYVDCYFESMSGLTTTGATILVEIESLPRGLHLWRALTHWLGGIGIVVLFVAVLPSVGAGAKRIFNYETTGPSKEGMRPHVKQTARVLWIIYLGLSAACFLAYWALTPMGAFDAVCHAFSTLSTGGFSTKNASIAHWNSTSLDFLCTLFMLLAGMNFGLFYAASRGRWDQVWKDTEFRLYFVLKVVTAALIYLDIRGLPMTLLGGVTTPPVHGIQAWRHASFVTTSMQTGTGFCTADYDLWPFLSQGLIIGLMFVGGCAGSTAGGVKVVRLWIACRVMLDELERSFRPNVVRALRVGGGTVDSDVKLASVCYVLAFFIVGGAGTLLIHWIEQKHPRIDFLTAMSASLATLCNVGPGLRAVGATQSFAWFSDASKIVMSLLMALGRLEFFALLVLVSPRFWRKK